MSIPKELIFLLKRNNDKNFDTVDRIKISVAIDLFTIKVISIGKAAEIAGVNKWEFMQVLKNRGIPCYQYTENEFKQDIDTIKTFKKVKK